MMRRTIAWCAPTWCFFTLMAVAAYSKTPTEPTLQNRQNQSEMSERVKPLVRLDTVATDRLEMIPMSPVQHYRVGVGPVDGGVSGETGTLVYNNSIGSPNVGFGYPLSPGLRAADDLRTICAGSDMTFLEVQVAGGGDGTGPGFNVTVELFRGCPSGGGTPIEGTQFTANLPNDGVHLVSLDVSDAPIHIPGQVWIAMSTTSPIAFWTFGGAPDIGISEEIFDDPQFPCATSFGGCPPNGPACANGYATIWAENCAEVFLAYRADILSAFFTPLQLDEQFADDVLAVTTPEDCEIAQYRVDLAGLDGPYTMALEMWSDDETNLRPMAPLLGTQFTCPGAGNGIVDECFYELPNTVAVGTALMWLVFDVDGNEAGPALVGDFPQIGFSGDCFSIFDNPNEDPDVWSQCQWFFGGCPQATVGNPCGTFQARVWCAGQEPRGACCDLIEHPDEPCIADTPVTQCFGRYSPNAPCETAPFDPPCGTASCCKVDETCENLTQAQCDAAEGLWQPGKFCGAGEQFCPAAACIGATGPCDEADPNFGVGCNDYVCCDIVCDIDNFCCVVMWDETCAALAGDFCPLPPPDECEIAAEVTCNGFVIMDNSLATDRVSDPGFSCHNGGSGQNGLGSVWAKFTASATSARLRTCDSDSPADDSLVAIYSGICGDLEEIGCSDDVDGCNPVTGFNSDFCINGLVPGQTYYVQLAAWQAEDRGRYKLEVDCPATCEPPANDACENSVPLVETITPYTTAGATTDGPALPSGPQPNGCDEGDGIIFNADIWYDYTSPSDGTVTVDLCSGTGYDSRVAVYSGCGCPATTPATLECNDDGCGTVNGPSKLTFQATAGQCYKIRIGGQNDDSGTGLLVVSNSGTGPSCPSGTITFTDPQNNTVDARQPHPVGSTTPPQGISVITATAPSGAANSCWRMCETADTGTPNSIQSVVANGNTYTINLTRPITPGAVTKVAYNPTTGSPTTAAFFAHPANVNGDSISSPVDILRVIDCLNGLDPGVNCPWGTYSKDIDQSGQFNPADVLRVIDLLNGADAFTVWNNTSLPAGTCTP